ncbi:MAG: thiamine phosphate synthase [Acidobacteriaceae bacterium]
MLLCAITDRRLVGETLAEQRAGLVELARIWAENGVALVQLREKDLPIAGLLSLAKSMHQAMRATGARTRLLLNAPPEVALAAGVDGIHLPAGLAPGQIDEIRGLHAAISASSGSGPGARPFWVSVSCHTLEEVLEARRQQVDCVLFAPVFEKKISEGNVLPGQGLEALAAACRAAQPVPVLALGGVTAKNAAACRAAGAAGTAAIRLFHAPPSAWSALRHAGP